MHGVFVGLQWITITHFLTIQDQCSFTNSPNSSVDTYVKSHERFMSSGICSPDAPVQSQNKSKNDGMGFSATLI